MLLRVLKKLKDLYYRTSSNRYINFLKTRGVLIGENTICRPHTTKIDLTRPSLITIGSNCSLNENFTLLTHDYVSGVFIRANLDFLPSSGKVKIGNNVRFGQHCTVLKGVTIGDNCFIGANSIVTKNIPANSVAVGSPCKVICSLEEFHKKREVACVEEALEYAKSIQDRFGRRPIITDFPEEFTLFVDGDKINDYPEIAHIIEKQCGPMFDDYKKHHKALYDGFDSFLLAAGIQ